MTTSTVHQRGAVTFPAFTGERVYMREFTKAAGLPAGLLRWQETVDAMLDGIDARGPVYLMVDQLPVRAGSTHRRPGVHVDGYWHPALSCHGGGGGGHGSVPATHGAWPATHRSVPFSHSWEPAPGGHGSVPTRHSHSGSHAETIIVATDVFGCVAFDGAYDAAPSKGGDCAHVDTAGMLRVGMAPGYAWAGHTLTMLHESIPVRRDCLRTVVRLNVPGWAP